MIKIFILSAGTNASYHFAKTLKEKFPLDFYIIGADVNPKHLIPTCHYLDSFYQVPYSSSKDYYSIIRGICKKEKIQVLLPSLDTDQQLFYPENEDLLHLNVLSLGTTKKTLAIYENKEKTMNFLTKCGLPTPKNFDVSDLDINDEYFIKPKDGYGSINTQKTFGATISKLENKENFIIQEFCNGPEITLECFFYQNKLSTIARERIATKAGVCIKTRIFHDEKLEQIAKQFVKHITPPLYFNLQFMKNSKDKSVITDVNLRLAGGMSLSYAAGWDEVTAVANVLLKKNLKEVFKSLNKPTVETFVVRAYTDIITQKSIVAFDLDGTLLDSRSRHKILLDDLLNEFKIKIDTSDLIKYKRNGKNNIDFLTAKGLSLEVSQKIQSEWIDRIENPKYLAQDILYPDALKNLKKYADYDLILITARNNEDLTKKQIESLGINTYFKDIYIVKSNEQTSKYKADILLKTQASLMIGDTKSDFEAAKNANTRFEHLNHGFHSARFIDS